MSYRRLTPAEHKRFDAIMPPAGPCAFCDGPDKRHRLVDSIREGLHVGDQIRDIASDCRRPLRDVRFLSRLIHWAQREWRIKA